MRIKCVRHSFFILRNENMIRNSLGIKPRIKFQFLNLLILPYPNFFTFINYYFIIIILVIVVNNNNNF